MQTIQFKKWPEDMQTFHHSEYTDDKHEKMFDITSNQVNVN